MGESAVLNPGKTDLTGPAKTILTKPTFLPTNVGEAAAFGGAKEASGAARVLQAGRILPALGPAVLAFGVGAGIGTEICGVLGIEGCWTFGSEVADPEPLPEGSWYWVDKESTFLYFPASGQESETFPAYIYVWAPFDSSPLGYAYTQAENPFCAPAAPVGVSYFVTASETFVSCNEGQQPSEFAVRYAMENRTVTYTGSDDPEVPNYSYTAPEDWSEKTASALQSGTPEADRVGQKIASEIEGSGVSNPYGSTVTVPNCSGEAWIGCKETLEELQLVPERVELDWQTADIELDPNVVTQLQPAPQTEVETGTKVTVTTNPDEAGMPLVIPPPEPGETYDDYAARLSPGLNPERVTVSPDFADPNAGPDGVIRTSPKAGTRANPATETQVEVQTNPADAPPAPGAWAAPAVPSIDLSPLSGVAIGCNDFPFGIFCWLGDGLTSWGSSGVCPNIDVPLGSSAGLEDEGLPFDFCQFEPAMEIVRPILVLIAALSMAYLFAAAAMGFGGGTNDD